MERVVFDRMAAHDAHHWWYVARRRILADLIARKCGGGMRILEIGCGTGHNLAMLAGLGSVDAVELDDAARAVAEARLGKPVSGASLPELEGIGDGAYDLVALLDVLEHVEGDRAAAAAIAGKLRPGGHLLVTVPANRWMWSAHDVAHHHFRRYSPRTLRAVLEEGGLEVTMLSHFNTLLFPLVAAARLAGKLTGKREADDEIPPRWLNRLLEVVFGFERHLVGRVPLPFGVSLVAVCRRPAG